MKALLLAVLAAVGLGGCYAEGAPYGAYESGYYTQPAYGYGYGVARPVYVDSYGYRGYRPAYRGGGAYVAAPVYRGTPGYRSAPAFRAAPAYHASYGGRGYRR